MPSEVGIEHKLILCFSQKPRPGYRSSGDYGFPAAGGPKRGKSCLPVVGKGAISDPIER